MKYFGLQSFNHSQTDKVGVLLVNLGSPISATTSSVRKYLKEFLSDPRVVEMPRLLWWLILNGIILRFRPSRSSKNYQKIWIPGGSPLLVHTQNQTKKIAERFDDPVIVDFAMRYGEPAIAKKLQQMQNQGVRKLVVLPLYPQYSGSTSGSVFDEVSNVLQSFRWVPELRFINEYHDDDGYINACATQIRDYWAKNGKPDRLILSYHGTPIRYRTEGDPYYCHCLKTSRLITEKLENDGVSILTAFQSRFGREPWLQPYADETLRQLPIEIQNCSVQVFCPGFSSDCLETLEEIDMENRQLFLDAGGKKFGFIPSLNAETNHIDALTNLVEKHLQGWNLSEGNSLRNQRSKDAGYTL